MLKRSLVVPLLALTLLGAAAPRPSAPATVAPDSVPHSIAMFLANLSDGGKKRVGFRATAYGRHFFFEEDGGVTVYSYDGVGYTRDAFLKGSTLAAAMKKYPK